ncbi:hypothetical protein [Streptomyces mexicanus]|uniref:hypothetical protein n=1 Tax=Streptomyces mexicanus TaxID=178566 RepID=UPI003663391B
MAYSPPRPGQRITPDLLMSLAGPWQSYTPTLTNTTIGNGSLLARYQQGGNRVLVAFILNWGSTTSGGMPFISVPVTPASLGGMRWSGNVVINPGGGARFRAGMTWLYDTSTVISSGAFMSGAPTDLNTGLGSTAANITMQSGGWIMGSVEYEAA